MKRIEHREGDVSFSLGTPSILDSTPVWVIWVILFVASWLIVGGAFVLAWKLLSAFSRCLGG